MVDRDRLAQSESDSVADSLALLRDRSDAGNVVILLERLDQSLQRRDVGIHLSTQLLESRNAVFVILDSIAILFELIPDLRIVEWLTARRE